MVANLPVPLDSRLHLLLLDNQSRDGRTLEVLLNRTREPCFTVERLPRLERAVQRLSRNDPAIDVVVTELALADAKGAEILRSLQETAPDVALVVLVNTPQDARAVRVPDYLLKGHMDRFTLGRILSYAVERQRLLQRIAELEEKLQPTAPTDDNIVPLLSLVLDHDALIADWHSLGRATVCDLINLFRTATHDTLQQAMAAATDRNSGAVARAVHLLASAAASLHLQALAQTSRQIEQSCLNGHIPTALVRQLPDLYHRSLEALDRDVLLNSGV